jgi:hypothetical protein
MLIELETILLMNRKFNIVKFEIGFFNFLGGSHDTLERRYALLDDVAYANPLLNQAFHLAIFRLCKLHSVLLDTLFCLAAQDLRFYPLDYHEHEHTAKEKGYENCGEVDRTFF